VAKVTVSRKLLPSFENYVFRKRQNYVQCGTKGDNNFTMYQVSFSFVPFHLA
jgi:hypothetical protein